jgi:hypothetical protein
VVYPFWVTLDRLTVCVNLPCNYDKYALSYGTFHLAELRMISRVYSKSVALGPIVEITKNSGGATRVRYVRTYWASAGTSILSHTCLEHRVRDHWNAIFPARAVQPRTRLCLSGTAMAESDFSALKCAYNEYSSCVIDFSLEGVMQCRQFQKLSSIHHSSPLTAQLI